MARMVVVFSGVYPSFFTSTSISGRSEEA